MQTDLIEYAAVKAWRKLQPLRPMRKSVAILKKTEIALMDGENQARLEHYQTWMDEILNDIGWRD